MRFISTEGRAPPVTFGEAVLEGPAPDGGLYVPERLEPLTQADLDALSAGSLTDIARFLARRLFGSGLPEDDLAALLDEALNFPVPLVEIEPGVHCLELFHGPTLAFKDIAARVMSRLMSRITARGQDTTVLVATSGDTGSAVAHAFSGLRGFRVCVLYPQGLVTEAQRRLFTTLAGNVTAVAVEGVFDDCQRLARRAFADEDLRRARPLVSANSINIGRLLPQVFYYFHAWAQLARAGRHQGDPALVVSTPSGNFGNLTAGLIARKIGLPIDRFVAATNINDVVPAYLESGRFLPRESAATISNAMDVGHPGNFARILHLYSDCGDTLTALRRDLAGHAFDDRATRAAMWDMYEQRGVLLDPHTAVGYLGLKAELKAHGGTGIVLATAHPAKFAEVMRSAAGIGPPAPAALRRCADLPERIIGIPAEYGALRGVLTGGRH
ncbi:threonine synthase [Candidatus Palauibacter sp.]|uniref:threonine synthase n=1 Tax=Candidatus Palauibacter sp. TaxID=3101350 RepID=UPI003CC516C2